MLLNTLHGKYVKGIKRYKLSKSWDIIYSIGNIVIINTTVITLCSDRWLLDFLH